MNQNQIKFYNNIANFIGNALGEDYEVVFHIVSEKGSYISAIVNSGVSGRNENSPLTEFALQLIESKEYLTKDYLSNYKATTRNGKSIRGSTFFIKDEDDNLEGMLCINFDASKYLEISNNILNLVGLGNNSMNVSSNHPIANLGRHGDAQEIIEVLSEDIEDIVYSIIDRNLLSEDVSLSMDAKIKLIDKLNRRGVFQLKGAVTKVAELISISEPSVYRYLRMVQK